MLKYAIIGILLVSLELIYFAVADRYNIIDKPNERSSHTKIVLRGGGVIFTAGLWIWSAFFGLQYPWQLAGVTLAAGISFIDDIHSLPDSLRLVVQFAAMFMVFKEIGLLQWDLWWVVMLALVVCVGASNIINFMDGINGITGAYAMASLIPLALLNISNVQGVQGFVDNSLIITIMLADVVFCFFNFREKGKAKCFAGDVGSVGVAYILLFMIGSLIMATGDITYLIFLLVYGVDGCLTIVHRMMLHENLGQAHRKHAFQLMANELGMSHITVSLLYACMQLAISLVFIYLVPNTVIAHWIYLVVALVILAIGYLLFMRRYYHLHEEYLKSIHNAQNA